MPTILDEILAHKRVEVEAAKAQEPLRALEARIASLPPARDFRAALCRPGVNVIAEIKRRAPSMKDVALRLDVAEVAAAYERGGAAAVSVLTDEKYFGGTVADLRAAAAACALPILRKEFIVDPWQIYEARAWGADAVLLIVRALSGGELGDLLALTRHLGMSALVECHTAEEIAGIPPDAAILGINNRDLATLRTDLAVTERLAPRVPRDKILVSESGIKTADDVRRLARTGRVNAVLVGAAVVGAQAISDKIEELVHAVQP